LSMEDKVMVNHFTYFVHIFSIRQEKEMLSWLLKGEKGWSIRLYNARKPRDMELVNYYLPYVKKILYPTAQWTKNGFIDFFKSDIEQKTKIIYQLPCKDFVNRKYRGIKIGISFNNGKRFIQGEIFDISLRLFKRGVGFLILKTKVSGEKPPVESLLDLNSCFRVLNYDVNYTHFPNIKVYLPNHTILNSGKKLIVFLTGGFISGEGDDLPGGRMLVYSYCCLPDKVWDRDGDKFFQRYKYVWQENFYSLTEERVYKEESSYAPWEYSRYGFTMESGVVLSCEKDIFNRDILPFYFGNYFFNLYLLSLYHRIRLMRFSRRLADTEILKTNKRVVSRLREDILDFFNRYIFNQVSNYSIGNEMWRKWQDVLEIEDMFSQVHQELSEMDEYLKSIRQEKTDKAVAYATFLLIPVSVISGILGCNVIELQNLSVKNPWVWGTTIGLYLIMIMSYIKMRRREREGS